MKRDQERCLAAGMDAYLSKPVRAVDLLNMLETYGNKECADVPA
jgi:CheY-like chemotaxis protein